jgi:hypothetical protein
MRTRRNIALVGLAVAALIFVAVATAVAARPFLSKTRVERAASARAAQLCATNPKCTASSAQCDDRLARNAFNCYINTYYPGPLGPHDKNCYFINLWVLKGHPPRLTHRRHAKGSYPGGPYGLACESGPD